MSILPIVHLDFESSSPSPHKEQPPMSIVSDSFHLDTSEPAFIRLEYTSVMSTAVGLVDEQRTVWFERASVPEIVSQLRLFLEDERVPSLAIQKRDDHISLYLTGPDQAPYVNFKNERTAGAPHAGFHWFAMSRGPAVKLVEELASL